jgi:hypothetical protein
MRHSRVWRPLTWVILVLNIGFPIWLTWWLATRGDCAGLAGAPLHICQEEENLHAPLGAFFIIVLWVFADVILLAIGFVLARLRPPPRPPSLT